MKKVHPLICLFLVLEFLFSCQSVSDIKSSVNSQIPTDNEITNEKVDETHEEVGEEDIDTDISTEFMSLEDATFFFDFETHTCSNGLEEGYNENYLGECGFIKDTILSNLDSNQNNYQGMKLENVEIINSNLTLNDLIELNFQIDNETSLNGNEDIFEELASQKLSDIEYLENQIVELKTEKLDLLAKIEQVNTQINSFNSSNAIVQAQR